jgi:hypothetical protein
MSIETRRLEISLKSGIPVEEDKSVVTGHTLSRRAVLTGATALGAKSMAGPIGEGRKHWRHREFPYQRI